MRACFRRFVKNERGATAVEYAMIAGLIALVIVGSVTAFADSVSSLWIGTSNEMSDAIGGSNTPKE